MAAVRADKSAFLTCPICRPPSTQALQVFDAPSAGQRCVRDELEDAADAADDAAADLSAAMEGE